eukprot:TRINITY_DN27813_c2_g1_i1.p1 TRINITY_DN27813_c2_g1~~TRINITY_DN27813_c2_g1_i1.p1  ORF type:complete len:372 (+),score=61.58 TRINITY_DN27813_c2_g1_i1:39-1154(+)
MSWPSQMSLVYHPMATTQKKVLRAGVRSACLAVAVIFVLLQTLRSSVHLSETFVGLSVPKLAAQAIRGTRAPLFASEVDAEVVGEEDDDDDDMEDDEEGLAVADEKPWPRDLDEETSAVESEEARRSYAYNEAPHPNWFKRATIDKHKVNTVFFDMFKKPVEFFPHKLKPGDTIRINYKEAVDKGGKGPSKKKLATFADFADYVSMRTAVFEGVIIRFKGSYHARTMLVRGIVGKGSSAVGKEMLIPIHSPLLTGIKVLRRGYIGQNKNAYFLRMLVGTKNKLPLDPERTRMDEEYANLRLDKKEHLIPKPEYPKSDRDTYPLPSWVQDLDHWDEKDYDPDKVDQRSEWEKRVIGVFKKRRSPTGKYGGYR